MEFDIFFIFFYIFFVINLIHRGTDLPRGGPAVSKGDPYRIFKETCRHLRFSRGSGPPVPCVVLRII